MAQKAEDKPAKDAEDLRDKGATALETLREKGGEIAQDSLDAISHLTEEGQHRASELRDEVVNRGNVLMDDLDVIYESSIDFVRRNPILAIGGAVVAGYLLSRSIHADPGRRSETDARQRGKSHSGAAAETRSGRKNEGSNKSRRSD